MDYERKYKELVANFKSVLNLRTVKENGTIPTEDVRKLIPELQMSEDDKIRKELIAYLEVQNALAKGKDSDFKTWIEWLKKQNDSNETDKLEKEIDSYIKKSMMIMFPSTDPAIIETDIRHIAHHFYNWTKNNLTT